MIELFIGLIIFGTLGGVIAGTLHAARSDRRRKSGPADRVEDGEYYDDSLAFHADSSYSHSAHSMSHEGGSFDAGCTDAGASVDAGGGFDAGSCDSGSSGE